MNIRFKFFRLNKLTLAVAVTALISLLAGCSGNQAAPPAPPTTPTIAVSSIPTQASSPSPSLAPATPAQPSPAAPPSPTPTLAPSPSPTQAGPSPKPAPSATASPTPQTVYTPTATPFKPTQQQLDYMNFVLDLINKDRQAAGLNPVTLNFNAAAQLHAQDMLDNKYTAHWGTDGKKPYMRYTDAGGLNYEGENSDGYSSNLPQIDIKGQLQKFETEMMAETPPNDSHRTNILNKWHKKVNIGIAYSNNSIYLVQQFEGDYLEYYQPPTLAGNLLSLNGRFTQPGIILNNVAVTYDTTPQKLTGDQLTNGPYHLYGLGKVIGQVFPPPPPGASYSNLPANSIIGASGTFDQSGKFSIQADISSLLTQGAGVYTIVLVANAGSEVKAFSNYSIYKN